MGSTPTVKPLPFHPTYGAQHGAVAEWAASRYLAWGKVYGKMLDINHQSLLAQVCEASGGGGDEVTTPRLGAYEVMVNKKWVPEMRLFLRTLRWVQGDLYVTVNLVDKTNLSIFGDQFKRCYELPAPVDANPPSSSLIKRVEVPQYMAITWSLGNFATRSHVRIIPNQQGLGTTATRIKAFDSKNLDAGLVRLVDQTMLDLKLARDQVMAAVQADALAVELESTTTGT
jgi:hypothetical protein